MIDLHAHVLPGIDDGPPHLDGTLELLKRAVANQTRIIAATPHLRGDFPRVVVEQIGPACRALQARIPPAWNLQVVPGGEVDLLWAQDATDEQLRYASYDNRGTDLLVETPYGPLTGAFEDALYALADRGFRILLAHPELNSSFQQAPERLEALVEGGVLLQITGASLLRTPGKSASTQLARWLVEHDVAHVIASDTHTGGAWRPSEMMAAHRAARQLAPHRASWMVNAAPAAILAGEPLPPVPARAPADAARPVPERPVEQTRPPAPRRSTVPLARLLRKRPTSGR
jgi:protein-tyrosine phosphatase